MKIKYFEIIIDQLTAANKKKLLKYIDEAKQRESANGVFYGFSNSKNTMLCVDEAGRR